MDWKLTAQLASTSIVALAVGWLGHRLSARRDFVNERRKLRINYLIEAYRRLEGGSNRSKRSDAKIADVESAIADIQLLGSSEQAKLARDFANQIAVNSTASVDNLINDLRKSLRNELNLGKVGDPAIYLRFYEEGSQDFRTALIATTKEVNKAKIEDMQRSSSATAGSSKEQNTENENIKIIIDAWSEIKSKILKILDDAGIEASNLHGHDLLNKAFDENLITRSQFNSLRGIDVMQNLAARGAVKDIDIEQVEEFLILANAISTILDIDQSRKSK